MRKETKQKHMRIDPKYPHKKQMFRSSFALVDTVCKDWGIMKDLKIRLKHKVLSLN